VQLQNGRRLGTTEGSCNDAFVGLQRARANDQCRRIIGLMRDAVALVCCKLPDLAGQDGKDASRRFLDLSPNLGLSRRHRNLLDTGEGSEFNILLFPDH
jgi:hypothetical protein